ncbi:ATP-binding protein [Desulfurococcaceae archaeon AG1]|nr:ATP-binding protein [Desulfurococcaceae archaeon AG1]
MVAIAIFDPWPKSSREELLGRSSELEELHRAIDKGEGLILVHGIKRIGKTSILRTFTSEVKGICLEPERAAKSKDLEASFAKALEDGFQRLSKIISDVKGVEVVRRSRGVVVRIDSRSLGPLWLGNIISEISKKVDRLVVAIDNAENIVSPVSRQLRMLISYSLDNLENVSFILAAPSSIAIHELLGLNERSSPLYGRKPYELGVEKLSREQSLELLSKGFKEQGLKMPREAEDAVDFFEGIPGWLVYFGRSYLSGKSFESIVEGAVGIAVKELEELGETKILILKAISQGIRGVRDIQDYLARFGAEMRIAAVEMAILKLEKLGILRRLEIQDPVYRKAIEKIGF